MSKVFERRAVACPYTLAKGYLAAELSERARTGQPSVLTLRAAVAGADFARAVVVTYAAGSDPMHFDEPWRVHWTPEGGGPYPDFEGELTVRADYDYSSSILELAGEYQPPGGALGAAFDHTIGSRIASATASDLLAEIGARMEARYHGDELAKRG